MGQRVFLWLGGGTFFFYVGGSQVFGVRTGRRLRPMDIQVLPWSRSLLGTGVDETNLGQKPKLGGVCTLLPIHCIFHLVRFNLFEVLPVLLCSFNLKKTQKDLSFLLLSLNLEKPKKCFLSSLVCFVSEFSSCL